MLLSNRKCQEMQRRLRFISKNLYLINVLSMKVKVIPHLGKSRLGRPSVSFGLAPFLPLHCLSAASPFSVLIYESTHSVSVRS